MTRKLISLIILMFICCKGIAQTKDSTEAKLAQLAATIKKLKKDSINNLRESMLRMNSYISSIRKDTASAKFKGSGAIENTTIDEAKVAVEKDKRYKRISIYSLVTSDETKPYNITFINGFGDNSLNLPEKYNSHDVGEYIIPINPGNTITTEIENYLNKKNVAKQLIAKWFRRNRHGEFNMGLVADRGEYDASFLEKSIAEKTARGLSMLQDAGEELIAKTFVCVYDFNFIDKGKKYGISMDCYLYRLVWDEASAGIFYNNYWIDSKSNNPVKKQAFDNSSDFKMQYVGVVNMGEVANYDKPLKQTVVNGSTKYSIDDTHIGSQITYLQFGDLFKKNYAQLEQAFEEFRTKFSLYSADPIAAKIGTKEDVKAGDKFEVVEKIRNKDGTVQYKQIGVITVTDNNKIWDNNTVGDWLGTNKSKLQYTVFEGDKKKFASGMLFRKIYSK